MLFFDSLRYISVVYIDLVEDLRKVAGRSEGKNLSKIRHEIKYIILGVDHFALSYI
jgi:hypothetical protein